MANGFFPLVAPNAGGGLNFEPVYNALSDLQTNRYRQQQMDMQQQQNALMQQRWQAENARADETQGWQRTNQQNALTDRSRTELGRLALAIETEQDPTRKQALFNQAQAVDPRFKQQPYADLNTGPRLAQAQAGMLPGPTDYGKSGTVFQGQDGRFYTVQFGANGQRNVQPMPEGMTPARGVGEVDTGTGTQIINKATGGPVREIQKDIIGEKRAQEVGSAQGKAVAGLPTVLNAGQRMLASIDAIDKDPNLDRVTGFVGGRIPKSVQFEGMAETQSKIDQLGGQTFLQAYNDLRGAGQISEREGVAAQAAYNRLTTQTMGTAAYREALREFRTQVVKLIDIAQQRAQAGSQVQTNRGPEPKQMGGPLPNETGSASIPDFRAGGGWSITRVR